MRFLNAMTLATLGILAASHAASAKVDACTGGVARYDVAVPGAPFSAVATPDEQTVFVSLNFTTPRQPSGIAVLKCISGRYRFSRMIPLANQPTIMALTNDGKTLIVPDDNFITFVDVARAVSGKGEPIVGFIEDIPGDDGGAIYAAISPDNRYAFVNEEQSGNLTVVDLQKARATRYARSSIASEFPIGNAPVALVVSKDGRYLFATVQAALRRRNYPKTCKPEGPTQPDAALEGPGAIVTIDLAKIATDPHHAIVADVAAGCHPVRAALTPDGTTLWVTNRSTNSIAAYATTKLIAGDQSAKIAELPVGDAPVAIGITPDGKYILVGNSNRFGQGEASVDVVDASTNAVVSHFSTGAFPRQFSQTRSGSVIFLANYGANTVTIIDPKGIRQSDAKP